MRLLSRLTLLLCLVLATGCGSATPTPAAPAKAVGAAPAQPTTAPTAAPGATAARPAEPTRPAAEPTKPAADPTKPAADPTKPVVPATTPGAAATKPAEASKPAGSVRAFVIEPDGSELRLLVKEQFAGINAPNDAVLTTKELGGQILVDAEGKVQPGSKVTIQAHSLRSDEPDRDAYVHQYTLESAKFPTADFVPREFRNLPSPVPASGQLKGQVVGDLTVHGVTRPVTLEFEGTLQGDQFKGTARTETKLTDFGMQVPRVAILISVEDRVRYEIALSARAQGAAPAAAAKPAAGPARRFEIKPDQSELTLRVQEQFAGETVNVDAVLTTKAVSGQIGINPDGSIVEGSKFTVPLSTLRSDRSMRDSYIKSNTLEVDKFPNAEFVPKQFRGLSSPLPTSGKVAGQLVGDMTLHGVTRPATLNVEGELQGGTFQGRAFTALKLTEFGMRIPRVPIVAQIEDLARIDIQITAAALP